MLFQNSLKPFMTKALSICLSLTFFFDFSGISLKSAFADSSTDQIIFSSQASKETLQNPVVTGDIWSEIGEDKHPVLEDIMIRELREGLKQGRSPRNIFESWLSKVWLELNEREKKALFRVLSLFINFPEADGSNPTQVQLWMTSMEKAFGRDSVLTQMVRDYFESRDDQRTAKTRRELSWGTKEEAIENIYHAFLKYRPDLMERYKQLDDFSPDEIEALRADFYLIDSGHFRVWKLSRVFRLSYFDKSYIQALIESFPKLQLHPIGFRKDYSSREKAIETVRWVLEREIPNIFKRYNRLDELSIEQVERLKDEIYAISTGDFNIWGLGGVYASDIGFFKQYGEVLQEIFPKLNLNILGFQLDWSDQQRAEESIRFALSQYVPDILEKYDHLDSLTPSEIQSLKKKIYQITHGRLSIWGLAAVNIQKVAPYFEGSFVKALQTVFPKLDLNPLGFQLDWSTEDKAVASIRFILSQEVPDIIKRYDNIETLDSREVAKLKEDIQKITSVQFKVWGLGSASSKKHAPYFGGSYMRALEAVFGHPKLGLTEESIKTYRSATTQKVYQWRNLQESVENIREGIGKNLPSILARYNQREKLSAYELDDLRRDIYQIDSSDFLSWGVGSALKGDYFEGSYIQALIAIFPDLNLSPLGFQFDWSSRTKAIESVRYILMKEAPSLIQRYDNLSKIPSGKMTSEMQVEEEALKKQIYRISSKHFDVWGLNSVLGVGVRKASFFNGSYVQALQAVFPILNLDPLDFELKWLSREEAIESIKHVLKKKKPGLIERYNRLSELSLQQVQLLKEEIYRIGIAHFQAWKLDHVRNVTHFNKNYRDALKAVFPLLNLDDLGFGLDWSNLERGIASVRFALSKEAPTIVERYDRIDQLSPAELEELKDDIYEINAGVFRVWGLSGAANRTTAPYFNGSYVDALLKVFDHPKLGLTAKGFLRVRPIEGAAKYVGDEDAESESVNKPLSFDPQKQDSLKKLDLVSAIREILNSDALDQESPERTPPGIIHHAKYKEALRRIQKALQEGKIKFYLSDVSKVQAKRYVEGDILHVYINRHDYDDIHNYNQVIGGDIFRDRTEFILSLLIHESMEEKEPGTGKAVVSWMEGCTVSHSEAVTGAEVFVRWRFSHGFNFIPLRIQRYLQRLIIASRYGDPSATQRLEKLESDYYYRASVYGDNAEAQKIAEGFSKDLKVYISLLKKTLLKHETYFGRDGKYFKHVVGDEILEHPQGPVKCLVVGARNGAEGYDVAICADETFSESRGVRPSVEVVITDLDPDLVEVAREGGPYALMHVLSESERAADLRELETQIRAAKFFRRDRYGFFWIKEDIFSEEGIHFKFAPMNALNDEEVERVTGAEKFDFISLRQASFSCSEMPAVLLKMANKLKSDGRAEISYGLSTTARRMFTPTGNRSLDEASAMLFTPQELQDGASVWSEHLSEEKDQIDRVLVHAMAGKKIATAVLKLSKDLGNLEKLFSYFDELCKADIVGVPSFMFYFMILMNRPQALALVRNFPVLKEFLKDKIFIMIHHLDAKGRKLLEDFLKEVFGDEYVEIRNIDDAGKNLAVKGLEEEKHIHASLKQSFEQGRVFAVSDYDLDAWRTIGFESLSREVIIKGIVKNIRGDAERQAAHDYWAHELGMRKDSDEILKKMKSYLKLIDETRGEGSKGYRYVIPLKGENETNFFDDTLVLGHSGTQKKSSEFQGIPTVFLSEWALKVGERHQEMLADLIDHEKADLARGYHAFRKGEKSTLERFWKFVRKLRMKENILIQGIEDDKAIALLKQKLVNAFDLLIDPLRKDGFSDRRNYMRQKMLSNLEYHLPKIQFRINPEVGEVRAQMDYATGVLLVEVSSEELSQILESPSFLNAMYDAFLAADPIFKKILALEKLRDHVEKIFDHFLKYHPLGLKGKPWATKEVQRAEELHEEFEKISLEVDDLEKLQNLEERSKIKRRLKEIRDELMMLRGEARQKDPHLKAPSVSDGPRLYRKVEQENPEMAELYKQLGRMMGDLKGLLWEFKVEDQKRFADEMEGIDSQYKEFKAVLNKVLKWEHSKTIPPSIQEKANALKGKIGKLLLKLHQAWLAQMYIREITYGSHSVATKVSSSAGVLNFSAEVKEGLKVPDLKKEEQEIHEALDGSSITFTMTNGEIQAPDANDPKVQAFERMMGLTVAGSQLPGISREQFYKKLSETIREREKLKDRKDLNGEIELHFGSDIADERYKTLFGNHKRDRDSDKKGPAKGYCNLLGLLNFSDPTHRQALFFTGFSHEMVHEFLPQSEQTADKITKLELDLVMEDARVLIEQIQSVNAFISKLENVVKGRELLDQILCLCGEIKPEFFQFATVRDKEQENAPVEFRKAEVKKLSELSEEERKQASKALNEMARGLPNPRMAVYNMAHELGQGIIVEDAFLLFDREEENGKWHIYAVQAFQEEEDTRVFTFIAKNHSKNGSRFISAANQLLAYTIARSIQDGRKVRMEHALPKITSQNGLKIGNVDEKTLKKFLSKYLQVVMYELGEEESKGTKGTDEVLLPMRRKLMATVAPIKTEERSPVLDVAADEHVAHVKIENLSWSEAPQRLAEWIKEDEHLHHVNAGEYYAPVRGTASTRMFPERSEVVIAMTFLGEHSVQIIHAPGIGRNVKDRPILIAHHLIEKSAGIMSLEERSGFERVRIQFRNGVPKDVIMVPGVKDSEAIRRRRGIDHLLSTEEFKSLGRDDVILTARLLVRVFQNPLWGISKDVLEKLSVVGCAEFLKPEERDTIHGEAGYALLSRLAELKLRDEELASDVAEDKEGHALRSETLLSYTGEEVKISEASSTIEAAFREGTAKDITPEEFVLDTKKILLEDRSFKRRDAEFQQGFSKQFGVVAEHLGFQNVRVVVVPNLALGGYYDLGLDGKGPTVYIAQEVYEYLQKRYSEGDEKQRIQVIQEWGDYIFHQYLMLALTYLNQMDDREAYELAIHRIWDSHFLEGDNYDLLRSAMGRLMRWISGKEMERKYPVLAAVRADAMAELESLSAQVALLPRKKLSEILGVGTIHSVLDGATGNAAWIRLLLDPVTRPAWLAEDAVVIGTELETPYDYLEDPPQRHWKDLTVIQDKADSRYPKPGTIDLVHESFMDLNSRTPEPRGKYREILGEYDQLLRPGGWMLIAQLNGIKDHEPVANWLRMRGYEIQIFWMEALIPEDYPKSEWWYIHHAGVKETDMRKPLVYLIVAQKPLKDSVKAKIQDLLEPFEKMGESFDFAGAIAEGSRQADAITGEVREEFLKELIHQLALRLQQRFNEVDEESLDDEIRIVRQGLSEVTDSIEEILRRVKEEILRVESLKIRKTQVVRDTEVDTAA